MRVELDGEPWRTLPAAAVVETRLVVGTELTRERARELGRELRRQEALFHATRAVTHRARSVASVGATLERRGIRSAERVAALGALERLGYLDDARFAAGRAAVLAERGYGDEGIRYELEREGIAGEVITGAIGGLQPERMRADAIAARSGRTAKTARRLLVKGFSEESVEASIDSFLAAD